MKFLRVPLCLTIIILLTACQRSHFLTLESFISEYNAVSGNEIAITDFFTDNKSPGLYRAFLSENNNLLTLSPDTTGEIKHCRLFMAKYDEKGKEKNNLPLLWEGYLTQLEECIMTFCSLDKEQAKALLREFSLYNALAYKRQSELTKILGNCYFVYYSTAIGCEMTIYNTYLEKPEATKKP